jgi:hypothetical protein
MFPRLPDWREAASVNPSFSDHKEFQWLLLR